MIILLFQSIENQILYFIVRAFIAFTLLGIACTESHLKNIILLSHENTVIKGNRNQKMKRLKTAEIMRKETVR